MSNEFEKFIKKNRDDFDDANPSEYVWKNIENSIPQKRSAKQFTLHDIYKWSAAAAVFFIALTSAYFIFIKDHPAKSSTETSTRQPERSNDAPGFDNFNSAVLKYASEFKEATKEVETRQQELRTAIANNPELYKKFQQDLNTLDSSYRLLKDQANQSVNGDVIIKAMIQNLQLQSELLQRQLMIIHEYKTTKTSKNEKNI